MTGFTLPLDIRNEEAMHDGEPGDGFSIIDANGKILGRCDDADMAASFAAAINLVCRRAYQTGSQSTEKFKENIFDEQKAFRSAEALNEAKRLFFR